MKRVMKIPGDMTTGFVHKCNDGDLEVLSYSSSREVNVRFVNTGFETVTDAAKIRFGIVKDKLKPRVCGVGYIGIGDYKSYELNRKTDLYQCWHGMIVRCYNPEYQSRNPTYIGCTVCKEWHNFQTFAEWMSAMDYHGKQLDKDIKVAGNKVYSPETCIFVSRKENVVHAKAKSYKFTSPEGDIVDVYNLREFCRGMGLNVGNMQSVAAGKRPHHKGWKAELEISK